MKKNFFIHITLLYFLLLIPSNSYAYSEDPKQFISEIVIEAKKILNSNLDKEIEKTLKLFSNINK